MKKILNDFLMFGFSHFSLSLHIRFSGLNVNEISKEYDMSYFCMPHFVEQKLN